MTLRIAHVTATFPPYRGGTGNVCYHNAHELAQRGHDVHVFTATLPGTAAHEGRDGFTIHRLRPLIRFGNAPLLLGLLWALPGFDVIHLHYPFFGGEITTLASRLNQIPLVITYHQDVHLNGAIALLAYLLRHTAGRVTLRNAARLLFTSLDYGEASYIRPMLGNREHIIDELPNGVDLAAFHPDALPTALRVRHHLAKDDQVALLVAGLDPAHYFKGVSVFLESLVQLPSHIKGVIVGDGELRTTYAATARQLGIASRVIFAGHVSDEDLLHYYRLASVTVLPSTTMGEAFGLVLVESLACATPVVASNIPGVRTVVDAGSDGLLVPPGKPEALADAISAVLRDEQRRQAMGQAGRKRVEACYAWEQIGERLEGIYQEVRAASGIGNREYARGEQ